MLTFVWGGSSSKSIETITAHGKGGLGCVVRKGNASLPGSSVVEFFVWKHARGKIADPAKDRVFPSWARRAIGIHEGAYVS